MGSKKVKSFLLFYTAAMAGTFIFSCGYTDVNPMDYGYKPAATVNPNCTCQNTDQVEATPTPDLASFPVAAKSPEDISTDKDYGWKTPETSGSPSPSASSPPAAPEKKKTLIGQWIEKIGNLFKKKKTE
jgi:hypothetical protein